VVADYSLYFVADAGFAAGRDLLPLIEAAVRGGVTAVQVRAKDLPVRQFLDLGRRAADSLKRHNIPLIINDRLDIALACGAAGVHLGQDDMPVSQARKIVGRRLVLGVSANNADEALEAERLGADYIGLGPIYATSSKTTDLPLVGEEGIRRLKGRVRIPLVAIGGITAANARAVKEAGADGIAVISAILGAPDPEAAARRLRTSFPA